MPKPDLVTIFKAQTLNHIEKIFCENYHNNQRIGQYLAERLYEDIHDMNHSELVNHIKMIDKRNIKYVMTEYRQKAAQTSYVEKHEYTTTLNTLRKYIPYSLCTIVADSIIKQSTRYCGLLEAIDTAKINPAKKTELIKYIMDTSMQDKNKIAVKNAKKDIASHPRDMHKIEIDLYRVQNAACKHSSYLNL